MESTNLMARRGERGVTRPPLGLTAESMFSDVCVRALPDIMLDGGQDAARQWWNWYMATPHWDEVFRVFTVAEPDEGESPRRFMNRAAGQLQLGMRRDAPTVFEDMPAGGWSEQVEFFVWHLIRYLNDSGCPRLRGERLVL